MKERPILFNGPMVNAVLDGSKRQTRRVAKLPHNNPLGKWEPTEVGGPNGGRLANGDTLPLQQGIWHTRTGDSLLCPHGMPGDRLWVRETYFAYGRWETRFSAKKGRDEWHFIDMTVKCDRIYQHVSENPDVPASPPRASAFPGWWKRPAIFMPRDACRTELEITGVRVERLQGISYDDARAEGWNPMADDGKNPNPLDPKSWFLDLWSQINGLDSWTANPWVWVIEFRPVVLNTLARKTFQ